MEKLRLNTRLDLTETVDAFTLISSRCISFALSTNGGQEAIEQCSTVDTWLRSRINDILVKTTAA